jgi:hypothetical protein
MCGKDRHIDSEAEFDLHGTLLVTKQQNYVNVMLGALHVGTRTEYMGFQNTFLCGTAYIISFDISLTQIGMYL